MSNIETSAPVDAAKTPEVAPEAAAPAQQPETVQPANEAVVVPTTEPVEATPAAAPSDVPAPAPAATEPAATELATTMAAPVETTPKVEEAAPKVEEAAPKVEEEVEELQNELTKKFTEKEWTALKQFRKLLPDIFKKAYAEKEGYTPAPIDLWTVTIDPSGKDWTAKASVILMKFLRARDCNVQLAQEMMVHTLRWRDEFDVEAAMQETFPDDVFGDLGHIYGRSKKNEPVTYNLYGKMNDLKAVFGDKTRFMRWRIKLMEEGIKQLDFETVDQMIQVHDYEGVGWNSRDANSKAAASEISNIFSNHYPEFLSHKLFVNVPSAFTWIFWLFKPLLPAATLAKMKVAGRGPHGIGKELLPLVDAEQLPKQYGGKADPPFGSK